MNAGLTDRVAAAISEAAGQSIKIEHSVSVSGGCINEAWIISTNIAQCFFVKSNPDAPAMMFREEARGLKAIRDTGTIRVPKVIAFSDDEPEPGFLVLEAFETGRARPATFSETMGRQLAGLHLAGKSDSFGFDEDNFIGLTPQPNRQTEDWVEFWIEQRMEFQFGLAVQSGYDFGADAAVFTRRLPMILSASDESPALIHGDLWSGNYLVAVDGSPVLIDPAAYYAHREAEFGMTTLFGGFDQSFYDAYNEIWPLSSGWQERVEIYRLYHLLNHLNLFGASYRSSCQEIIKRYI